MSIAMDIRALAEADKRIKAQVKELEETVLTEKLADYAAYCEKRGLYYGLLRAIDILSEVEKDLAL